MLSVIIITENESDHLAQCLESVSWANEIIIVDSGSTDDTVAIAKKYTPHVYTMADWEGYGIQKQRALGKATGDWVLNIDADEVVTESLKLKIQQIMADSSVDACRIPIFLVFNDTVLKHTSSPKRHIRLFRRQGAEYGQKIIHEGIVLPDSSHIIQLTEPLMHHSFRDFSHALYKLNRYSSYTAKTRLHQKKSASLTMAILRSLWMFFNTYFLKGGFLDGKLGFIFAVFNMEGTFYRSIKQIYPDRNLNELPFVK